MADHDEHGEEKHHKGGGHGGGHGHGGGGHEEGHEGAPEWLISFADNVTLMMGFFVILLAMNLKPTGGGVGGAGKGGNDEEASAEMLDFAIAMRSAFNNPVEIGSSDPQDLPLVQRLHQRSGESDAQQKGQSGREKDVRSIRPSDYYSRGGTVSFENGVASLNEERLVAVAELAKHLRGMELIVEVRGHVSAAEAYDQADRGMRLSYERALSVAAALAEQEIGWDQMRLTACADNDRAVALAYDDAAHRANQRVEVITSDRVARQHVPTR